MGAPPGPLTVFQASVGLMTTLRGPNESLVARVILGFRDVEALALRGPRASLLGDAAIDADAQQLGAAVTRDPALARLAHQHVAQVERHEAARELGVRRRGERDQLAVGARDQQRVLFRVVRHTARLRAGLGLGGDRGGREIDARDRTAAAQRDVRTAVAVEDDAAGLTASRKRHGAHQQRVGVDQVDQVAIRVGNRGQLAVGLDREAAAADGRRRVLGRDQRREMHRRRRRGASVAEPGGRVVGRNRWDQMTRLGSCGQKELEQPAAPPVARATATTVIVSRNLPMLPL